MTIQEQNKSFLCSGTQEAVVFAISCAPQEAPTQFGAEDYVPLGGAVVPAQPGPAVYVIVGGTAIETRAATEEWLYSKEEFADLVAARAAARYPLPNTRLRELARQHKPSRSWYEVEDNLF
jgi:hypothetical protein